MSQLGSAIGIAGNATYKRIPPSTVITYNNGAGVRTLKVFNSIDKGVDADTAQTVGNAGEWLSERKRNERVECHVECKPVGTAASDALAIAIDPPLKLAAVTIATSEDTQLNGTMWYVNSKADVRYSPDNDVIVSFDAILRLNDAGTALTIVSLAG